MALIIEDGTNISNANSYATVIEAISFAEARGYVEFSDDEKVEQWLLQAMDYLELLESRYQGARTYENQALAFPRYPILLNGAYLDSDVIPASLKKAQILVALEIARGVNIMPTVTGGGDRRVKREKIGPIETEYELTVPEGYVYMTQVAGLLNALFGASMAALKVRRG